MKIKNLDLIKNFELSAKQFYGDENNKSQKSRHWLTYNFRKFNLDNLTNFRANNILSDGLDDQTSNFNFSTYASLINEIPEEYVINNLPQKNIGNSKSLIKFKNVLIDYNKLIHIHWFNTVEQKVLKQNNISNICEIGGGFGSFSELFIKNYNTKLISIDLPEANLMTAYYLKENFPEKKIYLFEDFKNKKILSHDDFIKNDIFILTPDCKIDSKVKIDFFINARSMMEMNSNIIKFYFKFIEQFSHKNSFFLNINRYEKTSVGEPIRIADYPYDNNWQVIVSEPSFNQEWIHFLLTKRSFDKSKSNIKEELNKIRRLGEKFYGLYKDYAPKYIKLKSAIRKILKILFLNKLLNLIGKILISVGHKLSLLK